MAQAAATSAANETQLQYLSGTDTADAVAWDFMVTDGRRANEWAKIPVPSNWELQGFGTYAYGRGTPEAQRPPTEQGQYRYDFTVPAEWRGKVVRLVFDGAMTDTDVKVNGQSAGAVHQGSFYRFKYDVTSLLKYGETNRLEVTVSKESANRSVNNAERRGDYWNFGGIFRPVFLEALPPAHIDWTAVNAKADGSFVADLHLGSGLTAPAQVSAQILDALGQPVGAPMTAVVDPSADKITVSGNFPGEKLWTAETPNLYNVRFTLSQGGAAQHVVTDRFGFRTFEVRAGDGLYLNGQKIVLKGVNRHSFWPETGRALSVKNCYDDVRIMKEMNMNAVRMSHYPPDVAFLNACDELGLYVLDELAGWHGSYDTPTGQLLIGEMVRRDVNHPSILFWDNGNEGGWNTANDGEFAKWDPQQRDVLHPWAMFGNVEDKHYPIYSDVLKQRDGPNIYMATEIQHALYDGGGGVAWKDFWDVFKQSPKFGGAFFWMFADEGVVRTDQNGRLDPAGNLDSDGLLGPHREKEGSFNTIREIWSPVQLSAPAGLKDFNGTLALENDYDFNNLSQCTFDWALAKFPTAGEGRSEHTVLDHGMAKGPSVAPHAQGNLTLALPANWRNADVLYVTAKAPDGHELWTWSFPVAANVSANTSVASNAGKASVREEAGQIIVNAGAVELHFSRESGELASVSRGGKPISLGNGPRFFAYQLAGPKSGTRGGGSFVGTPTTYKSAAEASTVASINARADGNDVVIETTYQGPLKQARWHVAADGKTRLDYTYTYDGSVDLLGVNFDYPENQVKGLTWLGWGPYRVWQNRMEGTTLDIWQSKPNNPLPGVSWEYPEFQGYFRGWRWASLQTTEGVISVVNRGNDTEQNFLGIFTPHDAPRNAGPLLVLPETGLTFLDVIPAMRDKFKIQDQLGPQSASRTVSGEHTGSVEFTFGG